MSVDIYADEMFLINLIVNISVLEITKYITKQRVGFTRILLFSILFSALYTAVVISPLRRYLNIITLLFFSGIQVIAIFKFSTLKRFMTIFTVYRLTGVFIDGCIFVLKSYLREGMSYGILLVSLITSYLSCLLVEVFSKKSSYYAVDIVCSNKVVNINALMDTGNMLVEPISNKPVIVAEYSALKEVLPQKLIDIYKYNRESNLMEIVSAVSEDSFRESLRIIPFKSVDNASGLMVGFVADVAVIDNLVIQKPVIGICRFNLSRDGYYNALISPEHIGGM